MSCISDHSARSGLLDLEVGGKPLPSCFFFGELCPPATYNMKRILFILICWFFPGVVDAQVCPNDALMVVLKVETDRWAENSWTLGSGDTIYTQVSDRDYFQKQIFLDTFCISSYECLTFTIYDGFGDGITEGGGFEIYIDTQLVLKKSEFGLMGSFEINCQPGTSCLQAIQVGEGSYVASGSENWYHFTPDSIGTYTISTCEDDCDTQIWVYDQCERYVPGASEGFIFFDDNSGNCGLRAVVNAYFNSGTTYLIRIAGKCEDQAINWSLNYQGPVIGCMDANSCNFNSLASIDDGSCLP